MENIKLFLQAVNASTIHKRNPQAGPDVQNKSHIRSKYSMICQHADECIQPARHLIKKISQVD